MNMTMEECNEMSERLRKLADKYETHAFLIDDPSCFMHRYKETRDVEIVALVAAALAFGKRSEILSHIELFLKMMDGDTPSNWIKSGKFRNFLPDRKESFYRIFTYRNLLYMCEALRVVLNSFGSLGACMEDAYRKGECELHQGRLASVLSSRFPLEAAPLISKGETSANKRLNLFLRWMVRDNSPVDLGLWTWYPKAELLMPLDTHVVAVANQFGLLQSKCASLAQAVKLTNFMKKVFPDDPVKGDFALFGYGVTSI